MNKTDLTSAFEQTSFLYGGNAQFIEALYASYLDNPASVDSDGRKFFAGLDDAGAGAGGPSWQRPGWPPEAQGELVSALDGNWPPVKPSM